MMRSLQIVAVGAVLAAGAMSVSAAVPKALCGECRIEKFAACGGFLEGATIDARGGLWVVDLLSGKVLSVGDDGKCTVRGNTGGQPNGAKFGPDGNLYIADKALGLLRMDTSNGQIAYVVASYRTEHLRGLNDIAFDAKGGLYFTEPYGSSALKPDGRLFYLPPGQGVKPQVVSAGLAFPNGVVVSANGNNVLVGEYALKRITSLPAIGSPDEFDVPHVFATTVGGVGPDGMTLTRDGILVAANFNGGEIMAFSAGGQPLGTLPVPGGPMVTNVAVRGEWLYITEASRGEIWRVRLAASSAATGTVKPAK